ncbi:MAG: hypothetical protein ACKOWD_07955 [Rhodoferax sp.]
MPLQSEILIVGLTAFVYAGFYFVNGMLFSVFDHAPGVMWIFIPSGVRLVNTLLFGPWGAFGVALGSLMVAFQDPRLIDPVTVAVAALISGFAPLLARHICVHLADLKVDLDQLTANALLRTVLIFSAVNAALQQVWYAWRGESADALSNFLIMFFGDFSGALFVLYVGRLILALDARVRGG